MELWYWNDLGIVPSDWNGSESWIGSPSSGSWFENGRDPEMALRYRTGPGPSIVLEVLVLKVLEWSSNRPEIELQVGTGMVLE